jgi:VWFA-related protein
MRAVVALIALSVGGLALGLRAQAPPPQPPPQFRAGVDVVQLDVSVLDRNRRPIQGLTQADFTIFENGKPQPIVAFAPVDIPDAVEPSARWMRDIASDVATNDLNTRRIVIIVLDDAHIPLDPAVSKAAKRIANEVVDRLGPDDLAAVTFTFLGKKQDITSDRQRLHAAVESLRPHPDLGAAPPASPFSAATNRGAIPAGRGGPPPCSYRGKYRGIAACVVDTLMHAAEALVTAPAGRKTLVYISNGVPFDFSMDNLDASDEITAVQELFRSFQQANVNIYALDPAGLTTDGIVGPRPDALRMFAENTGGRATVGTNAPWDAVPQIFRENSSYYLLGFRSSDAANGRFRRIQVKVNRPDVEVRTRGGYYAPKAAKPSASPEPAVSATDKALRAGMPGGELTFGATAAPFFVPGQREAAIAVAVGLRQPVPARPSRETLEVTTAAFDADWKQRGGARQTVELTLLPGPQQVMRYDVLSRLLVRPGQYQVRVVAEQNGVAGSVFVDVDVPDFAKDALSLSGLVLGIDPPLPGASAERLADVVPVVPTTLREFRADARVTSFVRIYQGGSKPPSAVRVTSTIVDEASRSNFESTVFFDSARFMASRSADFRLDLPVARLEAGQHLLTIEATIGRTTLRRDARFTVR